MTDTLVVNFKNMSCKTLGACSFIVAKGTKEWFNVSVEMTEIKYK